MAINSRYPLKVLQEVEPFPPIQNTANPYATEAAMHADQANQLEGYGYLVDGIGAFTYLGTVAGTAADYEGGGGAKTRTRKEVPVTTQYTLIAADFTDFYLDFTADGGQTISLILNAGVMPDNGELRAISSGNNFIVPTAGTGTVIFIKPDSANLKTIPFAWFGMVKATAADTYSVNGSLESNVVSSGLDLRASNLAADLSTTEQDGIKTKVDINSYGLKVVDIDTQNLTTYDLLETSQIPTLYIFNNSGSTDGVLVTIKNGTTCPHIFIIAKAFGGSSGGSPATLSIGFDTYTNSFLPDHFTNKINVDGTVELLLEGALVINGNLTSQYISKGDFIKLFEIFESSNGTLYKVGVDDTGARTSIAL